MSGTVVAIGVFDGVHRGHRALVGVARELADDSDLPLVALTFDPHPAEVVSQGPPPRPLATVARRIRLLQEAGADRVEVLAFTRELSQMEPRAFVEAVLVGQCDARAVVVGENFRFGHRAAGDVSVLADLGADLGFAVVPVALAAGDGEPVSSTLIRSLVESGAVEDAAALLGRPHRVQGEVVHGDHRGRDLGYPTANLGVGATGAVPADGVYAGWLVVDPDGVSSPSWPAAISVGTNPTFGEVTRRVEAYAIDAGSELDLYGQVVGVDFHSRLRAMEAFAGVDELLRQMDLDVRRARDAVR